MNEKRLWHGGMLIAGCLLSLTASGQSGDAAWKAMQLAAVKEGRVVLYTELAPGLTARLKTEFEKANPGIVVEHARFVGPPLTNKVDEERIAGLDGADMILGSQVLVWYEQAHKQGQLKPPVGPSSKSWPAAYLMDGVVPVLSLAPLVIAYNTSIIKTPITGYQDMLRPELKGKVGTTEPSAASFVAWYDWLEKTQGAGFLAKFAAQNPRIYAGAVPGTQATASGEVALISITSPANIIPLVASGAPIRMVITNPSLGVRWGSTILAWARRPNAAQVFMDYLMSPRGQTVWHGQGESASALPGIPGAIDARTVTPYDHKPYTAEVVKSFQDRWNKLFRP